MPLDQEAQALLGAALVKAREQGYVMFGFWTHCEQEDEPLFTFSSNDMNPKNFATTVYSALSILDTVEGKVESYDIEEVPNLELNGAN